MSEVQVTIDGNDKRDGALNDSWDQLDPKSPFRYTINYIFLKIIPVLLYTLLYTSCRYSNLKLELNSEIDLKFQP